MSEKRLHRAFFEQEFFWNYVFVYFEIGFENCLCWRFSLCTIACPSLYDNAVHAVQSSKEVPPRTSQSIATETICYCRHHLGEIFMGVPLSKNPFQKMSGYPISNQYFVVVIMGLVAWQYWIFSSKLFLIETRPDTGQSSRGRLGRSSNGKYCSEFKNLTDGQTDRQTD